MRRPLVDDLPQFLNEFSLRLHPPQNDQRLACPRVQVGEDSKQLEGIRVVEEVVEVRYRFVVVFWCHS